MTSSTNRNRAAYIARTDDVVAAAVDLYRESRAMTEPATWAEIERAETAAERVAESAARMTGGEFRPDYNGHRNRETWLVALHLANDPGPERVASQLVRDAMTGTDPNPGRVRDAADLRRVRLTVAGESLREWLADELADVAYQSSRADEWTGILAADIVGGTLARVDWASVADGFAEGRDGLCPECGGPNGGDLAPCEDCNPAPEPEPEPDRETVAADAIRAVMSPVAPGECECGRPLPTVYPAPECGCGRRRPVSAYTARWAAEHRATGHYGMTGPGSSAEVYCPLCPAPAAPADPAAVAAAHGPEMTLTEYRETGAASFYHPADPAAAVALVSDAECGCGHTWALHRYGIGPRCIGTGAELDPIYGIPAGELCACNVAEGDIG